MRGFPLALDFPLSQYNQVVVCVCLLPSYERERPKMNTHQLRISFTNKSDFVFQTHVSGDEFNVQFSNFIAQQFGGYDKTIRMFVTKNGLKTPVLFQHVNSVRHLGCTINQSKQFKIISKVVLPRINATLSNLWEAAYSTDYVGASLPHGSKIPFPLPKDIPLMLTDGGTTLLGMLQHASLAKLPDSMSNLLDMNRLSDTSTTEQVFVYCEEFKAFFQGILRRMENVFARVKEKIDVPANTKGWVLESFESVQAGLKGVFQQGGREMDQLYIWGSLSTTSGHWVKQRYPKGVPVGLCRVFQDIEGFRTPCLVHSFYGLKELLHHLSLQTENLEKALKRPTVSLSKSLRLQMDTLETEKYITLYQQLERMKKRSSVSMIRGLSPKNPTISLCALRHWLSVDEDVAAPAEDSSIKAATAAAALPTRSKSGGGGGGGPVAAAAVPAPAAGLLPRHSKPPQLQPQQQQQLQQLQQRPITEEEAATAAEPPVFPATTSKSGGGGGGPVAAAAVAAVPAAGLLRSSSKLLPQQQQRPKAQVPACGANRAAVTETETEAAAADVVDASLVEAAATNKSAGNDDDNMDAAVDLAADDDTTAAAHADESSAAAGGGNDGEGEEEAAATNLAVVESVAPSSVATEEFATAQNSPFQQQPSSVGVPGEDGDLGEDEVVPDIGSGVVSHHSSAKDVLSEYILTKETLENTETNRGNINSRHSNKGRAANIMPDLYDLLMLKLNEQQPSSVSATDSSEVVGGGAFTMEMSASLASSLMSKSEKNRSIFVKITPQLDLLFPPTITLRRGAIINLDILTRLDMFGKSLVLLLPKLLPTDPELLEKQNRVIAMKKELNKLMFDYSVYLLNQPNLMTPGGSTVLSEKDQLLLYWRSQFSGISMQTCILPQNTQFRFNTALAEVPFKATFEKHISDVAAINNNAPAGESHKRKLATQAEADANRGGPKKRLLRGGEPAREEAAAQDSAAAAPAATAAADKTRRALDMLAALPAEQARQVVNMVENQALKHAILGRERTQMYATLPPFPRKSKEAMKMVN